ncbi:MAG: tetratricopeptide repeat protein [Pseudomonadales bacterium]|nr:tetratricopeptide repeat protein [Pseudomonadales bacterium]
MKMIFQRRPCVRFSKPRRLINAISIALILLCNTNQAIAAIKPLTSAAAVEQANIAEADSLAKIQSSLDRMLVSAKQTTTKPRPNFKLQEALITASGAAAGQIFLLYQSGQQSIDRRKLAEILLLENRDLLQHLLKHNEAVVRNYQEHELDKMADPVKFFESEQWQMPQQLISLASYWSGWNGYYASLLMSPDLPLRTTVLNESIEAFSRSFIDFAEDEITTKSLYGRGLVYKQLGTYGRAAYDFRSVKQRVGAEHPLYLSCLYQEALISYESGNITVAKAILKNIQSNYLQQDIPEFIRLGIKKLEAQFILDPDAETSRTAQIAATDSSQEARTKTNSTNTKTSSGQISGTEFGKSLSSTEIQTRFLQLKAVAYNDPELFGEFYRYSKKHAAELGSLSYKELTPTAALALADNHFESEQFEAAQIIYQQLIDDKPEIIQSYADGVWLRSAHIYNQQKDWIAASDLLANFNQKFPDSNYSNQVTELFYSAAISQQRAEKTASNYQRYIQATRNYIEHCASCPRIDDAYYTMGRHYIRQKKRGAAIAAFAKVRPQSTHYFIASFHVANAQVSALERLEREGTIQNPEAMARFRSAKQILARYNNSGINDKAAAPIRPNWALLQARFYLLPIEPDYTAAITLLNNFDRLISATPKKGNHANAPLKQQAAVVRAIAYQRLGDKKLFKDAIVQLTQGASGKQRSSASNYEALQRLANRFYHESGITKANLASTKSGPLPTNKESQAADAARFIYQQLATISATRAAYKPHLFAVRFRLAELYRYNQQLPLALNLYLELVNEDPDSADALYALGQTYSRMEQWRNALETWRQMSDGLDAGSPYWFEARYQTAFSMQQLDRADKACSIAKMTRILHPDLDDTEFAALFRTIESESCSSAQ